VAGKSSRSKEDEGQGKERETMEKDLAELDPHNVWDGSTPVPVSNKYIR